jgi:hypothetical protein
VSEVPRNRGSYAGAFRDKYGIEWIVEFSAAGADLEK